MLLPLLSWSSSGSPMPNLVRRAWIKGISARDVSLHFGHVGGTVRAPIVRVAARTCICRELRLLV